ncbi:Graves disease carrier protein-like [Armadillidium vulgare]|nr:Graves disease carrier protein-like [Armadillidium vulgare]
MAGVCAKSFVAPLDRIKILLQAQNIKYKNEGVFSGLKKIVVDENVRALYKGNGAQMVRILPYASTQFTAFEIYKQIMLKFTEKTETGSFLISGVSGSLAGVTAVFLTYPLDTVRARLAFQVAGSHIYKGIIHTATSIFRLEGGVKGLYKGFFATICGMVPYAGLSFYTFEKLKYLCMKYLPSKTCRPCERNTGGLVLIIPVKLVCGGFAGAVAQSFSYPLDVTRRRMQLSGMDVKTRKFGRGMLSTIRMVYQENGIIRGLYRGMSINYLRAIPMVAVSFSVYELTKQTLGLDTGISIKVG